MLMTERFPEEQLADFDCRSISICFLCIQTHGNPEWAPMLMPDSGAAGGRVAKFDPKLFM